MEILEISGYTEFEKLNIATRYLVPRQRENAGLKDIDVDISENAIRQMIHYYTMESGVRNLEREIGSVCRKIARQVLKDGEESKTKSYHVEAKDIAQVPRRAEVPAGQGQREGPRRSHQRPRGERLRRLDPRVRGRGGARQGQAQHHRPARKGHAGVRPGGDELHPLAPEGARPRDGLPLEVRRARSLPELRPEGRPERGHHDGDQHRERAAQDSGSQERRDDRRDHACAAASCRSAASRRSSSPRTARRSTVVLVPKENQKDLKEIPRRVLNALRIVLVEHMDEVLREALVLSDPDALFGEHQSARRNTATAS